MELNLKSLPRFARTPPRPWSEVIYLLLIIDMKLASSAMFLYCVSAFLLSSSISVTLSAIVFFGGEMP